MPLKVQREPEDLDPTCENCCICEQPTRFWLLINGKVTGDSPALCQSCALSNDECPTKDDWIAFERAKRPDRRFY